MRYFQFKENELLCEDVPLPELVEEYGTPLYVYSRNQVIENYKSIDSAFGAMDHAVCYALKANSNLHILKLLAEEGAGADVVSAGELFLALKAGFTPEKIAFAGVGKREDEIEYALTQRVFSLNAESHQELQLISRVALRLNTTARVSLRINPDIDPQSHPYITTGLHSNKFGIDSAKAIDAFRYALSLPALEVIGLHTHIGSQITKTEPFIETARFVVQFLEKLRETGVRISHIDFGGGFGVQYSNAVRHEAIPVEDHGSTPTPSPAEFVGSFLPILQQTGCSVWLEPGRSIVADAGILVTKVLYTKENGSKKFVVTDAGMTDLLRPSLYNAHHQIVPLKIETYESEKVDVVGPICETGDFLARDRSLTKVKPNDGLAVLTAGAYGFVNTSHYNARPRPAEILVNGERVRVIRQRETFEDLV
ncbi:MAG: diaminopimelate decarboxylase [Ignavibacteriales bacterium]|nr:diaminopimelate decarboxylase [Ignavibacteriales bacterium]